MATGSSRRAWIEIIDEQPAAELAQAYAGMAERSGSVANILLVQSLDPKALAHHYELYRHLMYGPSSLSRALREAIAVTVSTVNHCEY